MVEAAVIYNIKVSPSLITISVMISYKSKPLAEACIVSVYVVTACCTAMNMINLKECVTVARSAHMYGLFF